MELNATAHQALQPCSAFDKQVLERNCSPSAHCSGSRTLALDKLRKMLAFLDDMADPEELGTLPSWKVHRAPGV
jgi:hypothetical protein